MKQFRVFNISFLFSQIINQVILLLKELCRIYQVEEPTNLDSLRLGLSQQFCLMNNKQNSRIADDDDDEDSDDDLDEDIPLATEETENANNKNKVSDYSCNFNVHAIYLISCSLLAFTYKPP